MADDSQPLWRTAEQCAYLMGVKIRTFRMWERRGHITAVDGQYDVRAVLHWYDHQRDTRMDAVRQGLAHEPTPCNHDSGRPHALELSLPSGSMSAVDHGKLSYLANGTAASFAPAEPPADRLPQVYDGIADLPRETIARVSVRYDYLQRLGVDIDQALFDRVVAIEEEAVRRREQMPILKPTTVYYVRVGSLIKIGQTVDLVSRLRTYPPTSVLLATEIGERDELEGDRLNQFAADRAHRREWFHPSAALIEHINSLREQPLTAAELAA